MSPRARDRGFPAAVGAFLIATSLLAGCGGGPTQATLAQTLQLDDLSVSQLNSDNAALLGALLDPDPQVNLQLNHPFFYAIRDNQTDELLFVGVLMNTSAG
jgi:serine protease inhibitor